MLSASAAIADERQTVTIEIKVKSEDGKEEERPVIVMVWNLKYGQALIGGKRISLCGGRSVIEVVVENNRAGRVGCRRESHWSCESVKFSKHNNKFGLQCGLLTRCDCESSSSYQYSSSTMSASTYSPEASR